MDCKGKVAVRMVLGVLELRGGEDTRRSVSTRPRTIQLEDAVFGRRRWIRVEDAEESYEDGFSLSWREYVRKNYRIL